MVTDRDQRIRERAYRIWEEEGQPEGRQEEHWRRAEAEISEEEAQSLSPSGRAGVPSEISAAAAELTAAAGARRGGVRRSRAPARTGITD
jgi:hypothetical protein